MSKPNNHIIYTIGHSTRTIETFLAMLDEFQTKLLADVRRYPGSRKYPQFNQEALKKTLEKLDIKYQHFPDLGGRRKASKDSENTVWQHPSFRGYADYMETLAFDKAYQTLTETAAKQPTAIMCSEAVWWRCHRSMISDQLKADKWTVLHMMDVGVAKEHPYTAPARLIKGRLTYH